MRADLLVIAGVVVLVVLIAIQARVFWLWRHYAFVRAHAVACERPLDLGSRGASESIFVPGLTRQFALYLRLRTSLPDDSMRYEGKESDFPANAIEDSLSTETFRIWWNLQTEGQSVACGSITEADLDQRVASSEISYIFGQRDVSLKAASTYKLLTQVEGPSEALSRFSPALVIRTWATLKGYPLARWKMRDTALVLCLGLGLIALGLAKRRFEEG